MTSKSAGKRRAESPLAFTGYYRDLTPSLARPHHEPPFRVTGHHDEPTRTPSSKRPRYEHRDIQAIDELEKDHASSLFAGASSVYPPYKVAGSARSLFDNIDCQVSDFGPTRTAQYDHRHQDPDL
jgi:hypothetical protein